MEMVGRPVNIQGTRDWVMYVREHLMGQPYLTLLRQGRERRELRLLSYNIRYGGVGREDAAGRRGQRLRAGRGGLQEATRPDVVERLAAATGMTIWARAPRPLASAS